MHFSDYQSDEHVKNKKVSPILVTIIEKLIHIIF